MRITHRLAGLAALIVLPWCSTAGGAQSFEDLVEDALKRQQEGGDTPPAQAEPFVLQPPDAVPGAPPAAPELRPVEPGPRPYTPPVVATPPEGASQPPAASAQQPSGAAPPPGEAATPSETIEAAGASGPERTREDLRPEEVNAATFSEEALAVGGANPLVLKAQVLLDRAGASPGAIDGYAGGNLAKAVAAVQTVLKMEADGKLDARVWEALRGGNAEDVMVQYTISEQDLAYPFAAAIPEDFGEQARMPSLGYTSAQEMLAERFHMDEKLLVALNPEADFNRAGTTIWVASVEGQPATGKIARIVADKTRRQVRAYDAENRLIVAYPATIGSAENPSPSGEHHVESVAHNPVYYYDPATFVQGDNLEKLELPPGPNNPVGSTWIDLSTPGYGIHGTPEPTMIGKTSSQGCVRLTNWDVEELAGMVEQGVTVSFVE